MADQIVLTLSTGERHTMEVEDGQKALRAFAIGHSPFSDPWVTVAGDTIVRRDAIVTARIKGGAQVSWSSV